jgi:DNA topoisomerase IB
MLDFAAALGPARAHTDRSLARGDLDRERVLACAVRLLDRGFFRIGSEEYAEDNNTFGLATMLREHVTLKDDYVVTFDYPAKGGERRVQSVVDPDAFEVVAGLKRRRAGSGELLAYRNGRHWVDVTSTDINDYIQELTGGPYTAKDFRTWNATVLAASSLALLGREAQSGSSQKRVVLLAIKEVARYLGNTPAVARSSYIDPRVVDRFMGGETILGTLEKLPLDLPYTERQRRVEKAVLDLLAA